MGVGNWLDFPIPTLISVLKWMWKQLY